MGSTDLAGSRLLIVEDEYFLADEARAILSGVGADVLGPVATAAEARRIIESGSDIHGVLLDVNLRGEMAYDVADSLRERNIPFAFVTGYDQAAFPERFGDTARLRKPVDRRELIKLCSHLAEPAARLG
jgi:CheY-like chemotaxis protein